MWRDHYTQSIPDEQLHLLDNSRFCTSGCQVPQLSDVYCLPLYTFSLLSFSSTLISFPHLHTLVVYFFRCLTLLYNSLLTLHYIQLFIMKAFVPFVFLLLKVDFSNNISWSQFLLPLLIPGPPHPLPTRSNPFLSLFRKTGF